MKFFTAVSERVLKLFLSDVSAGACVPEHGCCCGTKANPKRVNCYGSCVASTSCTGPCQYY